MFIHNISKQQGHDKLEECFCRRKVTKDLVGKKTKVEKRDKFSNLLRNFVLFVCLFVCLFCSFFLFFEKGKFGLIFLHLLFICVLPINTFPITICFFFVYPQMIYSDSPNTISKILQRYLTKNSKIRLLYKFYS